MGTARLALHPGNPEQLTRRLWERRLHLRPSGTTLAATPSALIVAERNTRLVRLAPDTGETLWEQRVEDCWGITVIAGERCLYLSQTGVLHCFDLSDGSRLWTTPGPPLRRDVSVSGSVVLWGGWRGYHPLMRLSLDTGRPFPYDPQAAPGLRQLTPHRTMPADAVLAADPTRPAVMRLDPQTGTITDEWPLPAPVSYPDHAAAGVGDGQVVFLSGEHTVLAFQPGSGVRVLWEHDRNLPPRPPMLSDGILWLMEGSGLFVVDLAQGTTARVICPTDVSAVLPVPGGAWIACADGRLLMVDSSGDHGTSLQLPFRLDHLAAGGDGLVHALGKGRLLTLR